MCSGKATVVYTKLQQSKKEESRRIRGEASQIKSINLRFDSWRVVRYGKGRRQDVTYIARSWDE